jgi:hypothetical protein
MSVSLASCDKISVQKYSKEERAILAHGFRGLSLWSAGSVGFGLEQGRVSRWQSIWQKRLLIPKAARKERKRGGGVRVGPPKDLFPPIPSTTSQ